MAAPSVKGFPDSQRLKILAKDEFTSLLDQMPGRKDLVIDGELMKPLDRIASVSLLKERAKERQNMRQTKKVIEEELLKFHFERAVEEDTHFIPRKLFLSSVEIFKTVPKLENAASKVVKDGQSSSTSTSHL
uniref:Uncharacterized protein n=1 Tax=Magallana gigas TaxID=29159 RepID=A0A8W8I370_MAGGI